MNRFFFTNMWILTLNDRVTTKVRKGKSLVKSALSNESMSIWKWQEKYNAIGTHKQTHPNSAKVHSSYPIHKLFDFPNPFPNHVLFQVPFSLFTIFITVTVFPSLLNAFVFRTFIYWTSTWFCSVFILLSNSERWFM